MVNEATLRQVMSAILQVDPGVLGEDSSMDTIKTWDSLRHMQLVLALEDEFGVTIPDEDVANITSYTLVRLVLAELLEKR
ncbi:MAG: acyl carrier protein [Burkholderiales bacterium]